MTIGSLTLGGGGGVCNIPIVGQILVIANANSRAPLACEQTLHYNRSLLVPISNATQLFPVAKQIVHR